MEWEVDFFVEVGFLEDVVFKVVFFVELGFLVELGFFVVLLEAEVECQPYPFPG